MKPQPSLTLPSTGLQPIQLCERLLLEANHRGYAFALWRQPNDSELHLIIDLQMHPIKGKVNIEQSEAGFIVSPFVNEGLGQSTFLHTDLYFSTKEGGFPQIGSSDFSIKNKAEELIEAAANANWQHKSFKHGKKLPKNTEQTNLVFQDLVAKGIRYIKRGDFKKIVLSRFKDVAIVLPYDPLMLFHKITAERPNAFASFISVPGLGTWMGATPETLIQIDQKQFFTTVSLAGTQRAEKFERMEDVAWTQKEIEEQAMVSRYIVDCFKKIRLREFEENGPKTVKAANLIHLMTEFKVDMKAVNFEQLGSVMLELLHPTSAVCGSPLEPARDFILENEGYDRELYSGFLGPVNISGQTSIYVNLRCVQLYPDRIRLYAGAGITENSNPEKEWLETEYKYQTMLELIEKYILHS